MPTPTLPSGNWQIVTEPFTSDRNRDVRGLFINGSGELAAWGVEADGDVQRALLWTSSDVAVWRSALFDESLDDSLVTDVASGPLGFVAVGWTSLTQAVWRSGDGEIWSRAAILPPAQPETASFNAVAAGSQGFLAVGGAGDRGGRAAAWFSTSGEEWVRVEIDLPFGLFADVTSTPDGGFLAIGVDKSAADWNATAWIVSPDGQEWRESDSAALATPEDDNLVSIISYTRGYAAFGQVTPTSRGNCPDCDLNPRFWRSYTSIDGFSWERSGLRVIPDGRSIPLPATSPVEIWGNGLIAIGQGDNGSRYIWTSDDGVTWTLSDQLSLPDPDGRFAEVADILAADGHLIIGGSLGRKGYVAISNSAP